MSEEANNTNKINFDLVLQATDPEQCLSALNHIVDEDLLVDIVVNVENPDIRMEAVKRIASESQLCRMTERNCGKLAGLAAVDRVTDSALLSRIAAKASNKKVRLHALQKLESAQTKKDQPSAFERREQELAQMCETAQRLSNSWNWEYVVNTLTEMRQKWKKLDPDWGHDLCGSFDKACELFFYRYEEFQARQTQEQKSKLERDRRTDELEEICQEIESMTKDPSDANDGRVRELILFWQKACVVSGQAFEQLEYRFKSACQVFDEAREKFVRQQARRSEVVAELSRYCDEAEVWSVSDDLRAAEKKLASLSANWNKTVKDQQEIDDLATRFTTAVEKFESRQEEYRLEQKQLYENTLAKLTNICENVENVIELEDRIEANQRVKQAQIEWKNLNRNCRLGHTDKMRLRSRFSEAVDKFYAQQNEFRDQQEWEQWANLTLKEGLCSGLEELVEEDDLFKVATTLKKIKNEWHKTGPVPREKSDVIWSRYKAICDNLYGRCKAFFDKLDQDKENNLKLKEDICDKIESIVAASDSLSTTDVVRSLQADWSNTGAVHREKEKQISQRFRRACDEYFEARRNHLKNLRKTQQENFSKKESLCEKVEELIDQDDLYSKIKQIKSFNKKWKEIGPAPPKGEREVWGRFRTACDSFFKKLDDAKPENLKKKLGLIAEVEKLVAKQKEADNEDVSHLNNTAQAIVEIQQQWKKIGRVPKENEDEVWNRFNLLCNDLFSLRRETMTRMESEYDQYLEQKELLLRKLESLTESVDPKSGSSEIKRIIKEWGMIATIPKAKDRKLERQFRQICDQYFDQKRNYWGQIKKERSTIAKKREELCIRMELIAGSQPPEQKANPDNNVSISEQLKLAFEANFILGSPSACGSGNANWEQSLEEARKIQKSLERY